LQKAIALYKRVIDEFPKNRDIAAKALLQIGQCQEKLGNLEARKSYEQLLRDYPDQAEPVAAARARLAALTKTAGAMAGSMPATRQIYAGPGVNAYGAVSPDGRYLSFADQRSADLAVLEMATGKTRHITNHKGSVLEHWSGSSFSPDGRQIAYVCQNGWRGELRIIGLDGSNPRILFGNESGKEDPGYPNIGPGAWAADGKHILTTLSRKNGNRQMALISVSDGSVRVIKTLDRRGAGNPSLSPDGRYVAYDVPQKENANPDIFLLPSDGSREIPLVQHPANDATLGWGPDSKELIFASDRTGTMDVWLAPLAEGKPQGSPVLAKKEIGRIVPLGLTREGSFYYGLSVLMEDIYVATLDVAQGTVLTPPTALIRRYVGGSLAPDWSPDGRYLACVSRSSALPLRPGLHTISIRSVETGEERELAPKMNALGYNLRWSPDGRSILVRGYHAENGPGVCTLDAQTGEISAMISGAYWAEWSRNGKAILYVTNDPAKNARPLMLRDLETGQDSELFRGWAGLGVAVSPDDRWFAFTSYDMEFKASALNLMPAVGGKSRALLALKSPEDFGSIAWAPDSRGLLFVKRNHAAGKSELWAISSEGGEPRRIGLAMNPLSQISIHPDGRRIAYSAGESKTEIWVLENFLPALKAAK